MWAAYQNIPGLPQAYQHFTVNHTQNFVDPVTNACTNHVEVSYINLTQILKIIIILKIFFTSIVLLEKRQVQDQENEWSRLRTAHQLPQGVHGCIWILIHSWSNLTQLLFHSYLLVEAEEQEWSSHKNLGGNCGGIPNPLSDKDDSNILLDMFNK